MFEGVGCKFNICYLLLTPQTQHLCCNLLNVCTFQDHNLNYPKWLTAVKGFPKAVIMAPSDSINQQGKSIMASKDFDDWLCALMIWKPLPRHYFTQINGIRDWPPTCLQQLWPSRHKCASVCCVTISCNLKFLTLLVRLIAHLGTIFYLTVLGLWWYAVNLVFNI